MSSPGELSADELGRRRSGGGAGPLIAAIFVVLAGIFFAFLGMGHLGARPMSLVSSVFLALFGGCVLMLGMRERRLSQGSIASLRSSIRDAPGGYVALEGTVVPSELGAFASPAGGRTAAWVHLVAFETWGDQSSLILDESSRRPFYLDDGSGALARVDPADAVVRLDRGRRTHHVRAHGGPGWAQRGGILYDAIGEGALRVLRARGRDLDEEVITMTEDAILPGDTLLVVGHSQRVAVDHGGSARGPYAEGPYSLLVARGPKGNEPLFLATTQFGARVVPLATVLGIAAMVAAAVLLLFGLTARA